MNTNQEGICSAPSSSVPEEVIPPISARTAQLYADTAVRVWLRLPGIGQAQRTVGLPPEPPARHNLCLKACRSLFGLKRNPAKQQDHAGL